MKRALASADAVFHGAALRLAAEVESLLHCFASLIVA
jgi:hypothetical protein